jgi:hypothetical protein
MNLKERGRGTELHAQRKVLVMGYCDQGTEPWGYSNTWKNIYKLSDQSCSKQNSSPTVSLS